jgi:hypothetical protein
MQANGSDFDTTLGLTARLPQELPLMTSMAETAPILFTDLLGSTGLPETAGT